MTSGCKRHSKNKGNGECEITPEFLLDLYEKQGGLCYWFRVPMIASPKKKHPQQPSVDRLDRSKGYTRDNVVLACYSANIGRNESNAETFASFVKLLAESLKTHE